MTVSATPGSGQHRRDTRCQQCGATDIETWTPQPCGGVYHYRLDEGHHTCDEGKQRITRRNAWLAFLSEGRGATAIETEHD